MAHGAEKGTTVAPVTREEGSGAPRGAPDGHLDIRISAPAARARAGARLVVLIPALNEQETIGHVVSEIPRRIDGVGRVEIVVIDDGSEDLTADRAWAAGVDHVARHPGNRGLAAAFNRGATEALARGADIVVTLDADGQHDPAAMTRLVAPIIEGAADIVVAARPLDDPSQGSPVRRLGNRLGSWVARRMMNVPLSDVTSGYRAFSRDALMQLHVSSGFTYTLDTLIQAAGRRLRMVEIVSPARRRTVGTSRMTHSIARYIGRTGGQAFRTALHTNPLRAFGRMAATLALAAVAATAWFLLSYAAGGLHLPALLAALLLAIGAASLLICGLLADGISSNRRLLEDALHRIKRIEASELAGGREAEVRYLPAPASVAAGEGPAPPMVAQSVS
jgi:glycosyltransferase involved in cell wall biosynthesis